MLRVFFFVFFCCSRVAVHAQNWVVSGTVRSETGEALAGASVYADDLTSTFTDENGAFLLRCATLPTGVTARFLDHYSQRIKLKTTDFEARRARLDFALSPQNPVLGEVVISSKPIEAIVTTDYSKDIFDFGFAGEHLLLLLRDKKRHVLRLQTESGEMLSEVQFPGEPRVLHRSCLGDFHVVGKNQAWEITLAKNQLDTLPAYPTANFVKYIQPCALRAGDRFFFVQRKALNQWIRYISFREKEAPEVLFDIRDPGHVRHAEQALQDFFMGQPMIFRTDAMRFSRFGNPLEYMAPGLAETDANSMEALLPFACHECYDQLARLAEIETIRMDSAYAPLFQFGDTLCLFDHVNGQLVQFRPGSAQRHLVPIDYFQENGWGKLLLKDDISSRLYARFDKKSGLQLKEIDPLSGQVLEVYDLSPAPYLSEKWKIRNGVLYLLGQPDPNIPNMMLYKMNIFAGKRTARR